MGRPCFSDASGRQLGVDLKKLAVSPPNEKLTKFLLLCGESVKQRIG